MRLLVDLTLAFEGCSFIGNLISHLGFDTRWLLHDLRTKYGLLLSNCTNCSFRLALGEVIIILHWNVVLFFSLIG